MKQSKERIITLNKTKTAFISIVGCPNVGKSSLLNILLGKKVAIVSQKPQTTRTRITGVLTVEQTQYVFIDTPGFHLPKTRLGNCMVRAVSGSLSDVDACVLVAEPRGKIMPAETELMAKMKTLKLPSILVINKIDTLQKKEDLLEIIAMFSAAHTFDSIIPISALTGEGIGELKTELEKHTVESPHFFESDTLTDQPERILAAEMLREKLLRLLDKEIPHGIAVFAERMKERGNGMLDIELMIFCEKESHKGIIIGKHGALLKKASTQARQDMEEFFGCKVNLQTWVKVKDDWRNRAGLIRDFGLDG